MKPYTLATIYQQIKDAVKLWPIVPNKPNTWAVLTSFSDLNTGNLGKTILDKDQPYFYSKAWADKMFNPSALIWQPPGIFAFETEGVINLKSSNEIRYVIEFAVLDAIEANPDQWVKVAGEDRNQYQLFEDTENVLLQLVNFIRKDLVVGGGWDESFRGMFDRDNDELSFTRFEGGSGLLLGNVVSLTFTIPCISLDLNLRTFKEEHVTHDQGTTEQPPEALKILADLSGEDTLTGLGGDGNLGGL